MTNMQTHYHSAVDSVTTLLTLEPTAPHAHVDGTCQPFDDWGQQLQEHAAEELLQTANSESSRRPRAAAHEGSRVRPRKRTTAAGRVNRHARELACPIQRRGAPTAPTARSRALFESLMNLWDPDERFSSLPTHPLSAMFTVACLLLLSAAHAIQLGAAPRGRGAQSAAVSSEVSSMPVSLDVLSEIQQTVAGQVTSCTWPLTAPDHSPSS